MIFVVGEIWSKMLPPERLHSTMNQKSARTLLTTDVPQCVSKQGRTSAGGGGWRWWRWWSRAAVLSPDHTHLHHLQHMWSCEVQRSQWDHTFQLGNIIQTFQPRASANLCTGFYKKIFHPTFSVDNWELGADNKPVKFAMFENCQSQYAVVHWWH